MKGIAVKKIIDLSLSIILCAGGTAWAEQAERGFYYINDLEEAWVKVYPKTQDGPMLANILNNYLSDGKLVTGSGTELSVTFPVKNFDGPSLKSYLNAQARLGLMKTLLSNYVGISHDNYEKEEKEIKEPNPARTEKYVAAREQRINLMKNRLNLESFVLHMASFAKADNMGRRCSSWRLAGVVAERMQFTTLNDQDIADASDSNQSWVKYLAAAQAFYNSSSGFRQIPPSLCELNTVNSRADTMDQMQTVIDTAIATSMGEALSAFNKLLHNQITNIGTTVANSEIQMPAGELFELERTFRDLSELLNLVQCDSLSLYSTTKAGKCTATSSNNPAVKTLLQRLDENIKKMSTTDAEDVARANLNTFEVFFQKVLDQLAVVSNAKGLTADQKKSLKACELVKTAPAATARLEDFKNFQNNYDSCLSSLAVVFIDLKKDWSDPPLTLSFARELGSLAYQMTLFIQPK